MQSAKGKVQSEDAVLILRTMKKGNQFTDRPKTVTYALLTFKF